MIVSIDAAGPTPPYEQLRSQLVEQISAGTLTAGTRLPTVRKLADDLGLAPNTVARAYRELERDGFIETHGRNGTLVSAQADVAEQQAQLAAHAYLARTRELGLADETALGILKSATN